MSLAQADVVEALVREYLVRAGCSATLEAFNREKPKHSNSITKREVLRKTLGLDKAAAYYKKQNPTADGIPSTLEVWVNYQMARVAPADGAPPAPAPAPVPAPRAVAQQPASAPRPAQPPAQPAAQPAAQPVLRPMRTVSREEDPEDASSPVPPPSSGRSRPGSSSSLSSQASSASAQPGAAGRPAPPRQGFGFAEPAATPKPAAPVRKPSQSRVDDDDPDEPEFIRPSSRPGSVRSSTAGSITQQSPSISTSGASQPRPSPAAPASSSNPASRTGSSSLSAAAPPSRSAAPPAVRPPPGGAAAPPRPVGRSQPAASTQGETLAMEDVEDESFLDDGGLAPPTGAIGAMRIATPTTRKPGSSIPPDTMRQLRALLWGGQGQPPPSWKQGLFFSRAPGLGFGLLQRQGGPCGVLAALQAHVLAALHTGSGFNTSPRSAEQQAALTAAVSEVLWQARAGPAAVLVLPEGEAGGQAGKLGYDALSRTVASHSAASKEALADLVRGALPVLMSEGGWGVVLFVMSLVLSRGIASVQADMDEPGNGLMGMHGYCTQELVNLILIGTATSNVFDGNRQLDGATTLRGVSRRCKVGFLTLFEWYKYVEVGPSMKNPALPVWVVCSESHFTVLFSPDSRPLANQLPFELQYYDELANQEAPIRLTVSKDPAGGWTAKMGPTIGDRGKCEGANIPPLECVIETRWPGVRVNWNGTEPIL